MDTKLSSQEPVQDQATQDILDAHARRQKYIDKGEEHGINSAYAAGASPDDLTAHNNATRDQQIGALQSQRATYDMADQLLSAFQNVMQPALAKQESNGTQTPSMAPGTSEILSQLNALANSKVSNGGIFDRIMKTAATNDPRNLLPNSKLGMETAEKVLGLAQSQQQHQFDLPKTLLDMAKASQDMQTNTPEAKLDYAKKEKEQAAAIDSQTKQQEELSKANQESEKSFNQIMNLSDNMASALKGAYAQQGGGGPIKGMIGNAKAALGMQNTGNIKGLREVKRATAISYARTLAQGSRGAVTLFNSILQSMPDNKFTSEQAGTTLAEMGLTAYALHKGIRDLGLSKDQVNSMSQDQLKTLMEKEKLGLDQETQDKIYNGIAEKFKNIAPRKSVDLEGNVSVGKKTASDDSAKLKSLGLDPNRFEIVR